MPELSIIIIIILLLVAVVLLAPFHISLNMEKDGPVAQGFYRISWLGITLHRERIYPETPGETNAPIGEPMVEKAKGDEERKTEEIREDEYKKPPEPERLSEQTYKQTSKQPSKQSPIPGPDFKELIEALPALARVFIGLIRSIDIEKIFCKISFGLDDPAETAAMSGYLWSIASALRLYKADVHIEPYFGGERLDGRFLAEIKARLLWIALAFVKAVKEEKIRGLIMGIIRKEMARDETQRKEMARKKIHEREAA